MNKDTKPEATQVAIVHPKVSARTLKSGKLIISISGNTIAEIYNNDSRPVEVK